VSAAGIFITFEGGDGAGKTTQTELLAEWISTRFGREVIRTFEPGDTEVGKQIRSLVLHGEDLGARSEALLFAADRAHHVSTLIRPAIDRGAVVLCDRYIDSSVAYQGAGRELEAQEIRDLSLWATENLTPDLTVVLDIDPARGLVRRGDEPDRMERESLAFHEAVRESFLAQARADAHRYLVLNALEPITDLHEAITKRIEPLLVGGL